MWMQIFNPSGFSQKIQDFARPTNEFSPFRLANPQAKTHHFITSCIELPDEKLGLNSTALPSSAHLPRN